MIHSVQYLSGRTQGPEEDITETESIYQGPSPELMEIDFFPLTMS